MRGSRVEFWSMHGSVNWRHRISEEEACKTVFAWKIMISSEKKALVKSVPAAAGILMV